MRVRERERDKDDEWGRKRWRMKREGEREEHTPVTVVIGGWQVWECLVRTWKEFLEIF